MESADIPSVKGLLVLDGEGKRIVARYYSSHFASSADELAFEKKLFDKTARTNAKTEAEIIILDGLITVYKNSADVWLYVVGSQSENELILVTALCTFAEALQNSLRMPPDKRLLLDNFDTLLLAIDELIDGGTFLELDASAIVNRITMKGADASIPGEVPGGAAGYGDQTFNSMFASAREQVARALLK
uniref:Coatomer subunit zeta n=1 Tax=Prymnesium polylepis TaxID=72548 RepID=A0A6V3YEI3_9EUKA|mmetsp:Transcript_22427/g.60170  ORF Transcript_22427/g.60170 Transcript_22427/m.60170 type:complete len:189 (+) Transcript_22427:59-625(+)